MKREGSSSLSWMVNFFGGGLSGVVAKTCVAPLDRVKILFQTLSKTYPNMSPIQTLRAVYQQEGAKGLWY
jgi:solute carrier family 25 protein 16